MYIYPCFLIPMLFLFLLAPTNYLPHMYTHILVRFPNCIVEVEVREPDYSCTHVIRGHVATHTPTPKLDFISFTEKNPLP